MTHFTDEEIMSEIKSGDLEKLSVLFQKYKVLLYNYFVKQTYNRELSNDFVQNVFYRIIRYRMSFDEEQKFKTWMFRISRNIIADHFNDKKNKNKESQIDDVLNYKEIISDESNEKHEKSEQLYRAMDKLTSDKREILVMCKLNGIKYKDVADILDITESAVKVKVHRAINELKEYYFQLN